VLEVVKTLIQGVISTRGSKALRGVAGQGARSGSAVALMSGMRGTSQDIK
jgi:hypothetical protein